MCVCVGGGGGGGGGACTVIYRLCRQHSMEKWYYHREQVLSKIEHDNIRVHR